MHRGAFDLEVCSRIVQLDTVHANCACMHMDISPCTLHGYKVRARGTFICYIQWYIPHGIANRRRLHWSMCATVHATQLYV